MAGEKTPTLLKTWVNEIRTSLPQPIERDEWRYTRFGLLTAVQEMSKSPNSIITEELRQRAKESNGKDIKIPVFKIGDVEVKNVRSCQIGELDNETDIVNVQWVTLVADMDMKKEQYHRNQVTYLQDMQRKLRLIEDGFSRAIEELVFAKLDTEKSIINNSPLLGMDYSVSGNTIQVPNTRQEYFFNDLETIMEGDEFYSTPFKVIASNTLKPAVTHYSKQGGGNDENLEYQFGNYDFRFSNNVVIDGGKRATGYCMPDGSMGLMTRLTSDHRNDETATDGTIWGRHNFDRLGYEVGTMYKSSCADLSKYKGMEDATATKVEYWQFSFDVAIITPYNSDPSTKAGAIKKFEFVN